MKNVSLPEAGTTGGAGSPTRLAAAAVNSSGVPRSEIEKIRVGQREKRRWR